MAYYTSPNLISYSEPNYRTCEVLDDNQWRLGTVIKPGKSSIAMINGQCEVRWAKTLVKVGSKLLEVEANYIRFPQAQL